MTTNRASSTDRSEPCKYGHSREDAYAHTNTYTRKDGTVRSYPVLICRTCVIERSTARYERVHGRRPRPEPNIPGDPMTLSYVAGLFDGEGTVGIRMGRKPGTTEGRFHSVNVAITSTERSLVDWLKETFGGQVNPNHKENADRNYKDAWKWQLLSRHAGAFLEAVRPYLRVKGPQADVALRLRAVTGPGGRIPLTDDQFAERETLRLELRALNRRGRDPEGGNQ